MRPTCLLLIASPLLALGLGCGSSSSSAPQPGPSAYTKETPSGAAPVLGKGNKRPGIRLSNEGAAPPR